MPAFAEFTDTELESLSLGNGIDAAFLNAKHRRFARQQPLDKRCMVTHAQRGIAITCLSPQLPGLVGVALRATPLMHLAAPAGRLGQQQRALDTITPVWELVNTDGRIFRESRKPGFTGWTPSSADISIPREVLRSLSTVG